MVILSDFNSSEPSSDFGVVLERVVRVAAAHGIPDGLHFPLDGRLVGIPAQKIVVGPPESVVAADAEECVFRSPAALIGLGTHDVDAPDQVDSVFCQDQDALSRSRSSGCFAAFRRQLIEQQHIRGHMQLGAQCQKLLHLRVSLALLPFSHGLAAHIEPLCQLLLGQAADAAGIFQTICK